MALNCGIVGLPNVGKSTLFSALSSTQAEAANYPFCTIDPNIGLVTVPDVRLKKLNEIIKPEKTIPAVVEFVDIAGLVKGASKGEGLGNQFLGHIRNVGVIAHVVRCFENDDITHVNGKVDPLSDIETINTELALADLDAVLKKEAGLDKLIKSQNKEMSVKAKKLQPLLEKVRLVLEEGKPASSCKLTEEEGLLLDELHLLTAKMQIIVCNMDENGIVSGNEFSSKVESYCAEKKLPSIRICAQIEKEISLLDSEEAKIEFMEDIGIDESGLNKLVRKSYELLGLETYFTAGKKEVRAWTFVKGAKAPQAAGIIHSDFERGFIKAEVYSCDDLFLYGQESKDKENGKLRLEGKEYVVKDGDIVHFRFNV